MACRFHCKSALLSFRNEPLRLTCVTHEFTFTRTHNSHRDSKSKRTQHHTATRRNADHFPHHLHCFPTCASFAPCTPILFFLLFSPSFPRSFAPLCFQKLLFQELIMNNSHPVGPLTGRTLLNLPHHLLLELHAFTILTNHISVSDQLLRSLVSLDTNVNLHLGVTSVVTTTDSDFVSHAAMIPKLSLP